MGFEWDEAKNAANKEKHGISFENAAEVFLAPVLRKVEGRKDYGEVRYIAIGRLGDGETVALVYTERGTDIRIISVRRASRDEREIYDEKIR